MPAFFKKFRIRGSRHSALDIARSRVAIISVIFMLAYILVGARVFDLAVIQKAQPGENDARQFAESVKPAHFRADITDRNGVILATSLETASLYANPALIPTPEHVARELSALFPDLVYGDVLQKLQSKSRFVWIKRSLTPGEQYEVLKLGHPGLDFKAARRRVYPQGAMAAHIVGYTDIDGRGIAGIEHSFDRLLAGGEKPLALTLDIRLQHILRREILAAVNEFSAAGGAGAIVDIASGEVLAAVSLPDFDPHEPGPAEPVALFNKLTLGVFELGSTFKIFSTAALLETQNVGMDKTFDAREPLKRGRHKISDHHPEKRILTVPEVFIFSSNIGAALMGETVGTEKLKAFYRDLGLLDRLAIEINEVGRPIVPRPWRESDTLTASFGHGIATSPLQLVVAAASIVNGGLAVRPTLILGKNTAKNSQNDPAVRVVSPQTAHRMRQLMRLAVTDGTGKAAEVPGYNVGGKTGTAEKSVGGKYDRKKKISSFIAFFPMNAPRYAVFVMVDEPQGTRRTFGYATGGWVAAPAAGKIIRAMGPVLGIVPEETGHDDGLAVSLKPYVRNKEGGAQLATY